MDDLQPMKSEAALRPIDLYERLVREAYIDPIRSVLVVDDEFPSLDGYIASSLGTSSAKKVNSKNIKLVNEILSFCRTKDKPWLVDVHDASESRGDSEINIARHLHHSDLMILDYHLRGEAGGGDASIEVVRSLAMNEHFNMVIVYTKGYTENDVHQVFFELLSGLASSEKIFMGKEEYVATSSSIDEWLEENNLPLQDLDLFLSYDQYLLERFKKPGFSSSGNVMGELANFFKDKSRPEFNPAAVFSWLMQRRHNEKLAGMFKEDVGSITFAYRPHNETNWIRSSSLFLTVVNKEKEPNFLEEALFVALIDSMPPPQQLLIAKMRSQVDGRGAIAESQILDDVNLQAGWFRELINSDEHGKVELIDSSISRHWDALGDRLREEMRTFANSLWKSSRVDDRQMAMQKFFGSISQSDKILPTVNAYNNTKPVCSSHLMTGHVLDLSVEEDWSDLWLCLTPACDLVPNQKTGMSSNSQSYMPFNAVKLNSVSLGTAMKKANENVFVFFRVIDEIKAFCFCPDSNAGGSPQWERMFAGLSGIFEANNSLRITRLGVPDPNKELALYEGVAHVVAHLRYEYAINLLQKLSQNLSRVGLDYFSSKERV